MFTKNIKITAFSALILGSSFIAMMLILGASIATASASTPEETPSSVVLENSFALCHDGLDNDNNGNTDMSDRNCAGFTAVSSTVTETTNVVLENSFALCHDGVDNDDNGTKDMGDRNCAGFLTNSLVAEGSYALCHDGLDNDDNGTTDMSDRNCAGFTTTENSYALCHDGLDNDNNGTTDMSDRSCSAFTEQSSTTTTPVTPVTPTPTPVFGGGGGSSSGSYYSFSPTSASAGSVLGASVDTDNGTTTCGEMFKTYMKKGKKNNKAEVVKLQKFLNKELGIKLPTTGNFGSLTEKAVRSFQIKYSKAILTPWVDAGLMKNSISTGYFFKTTQYQANKIICSSEIKAFPILK